MDVAVNQPELDLIRDSAAGFAARHVDHAKLRARRETLPGAEPDVIRDMAAAGWFATLVPEAHGGLGLGFAEMAAVLRALGRGLLAEPLAALAVAAPRALLHGDNEALKARLLPGIAGGEHLLALAWQERADGDPQRVETRAAADGDGARLSGRKRFVAGAPLARGFLVSARAAAGIGLYHVAADAPGLKLSHEWRADGTPSGVVELSGVRVAAADIAASPKAGGAALARALDEAAAMVSAEMLGVIDESIARTLDYMRTRVQFDRPIGSFQALQHRAVDLEVKRTLADAALGAAVAALDHETGPDERARIVSRCKTRCGEVAVTVGREAVQLHGAIGFTDEHDIGLYLKRATVLAAAYGTGDAHRRRFARLRPSQDAAQAGASPRPAPSARALAIMDQPQAERNWEALDDEEFRALAADFFARHLPVHLKFLTYRPGWDEIGDWFMTLSRSGWLAPAWPVEYGGMGLGPGKLIIYFDEMGRLGAPRILDQGLNNIGSALISRGTPEQKAYFLPKILTGEHIWCQGYSEPNAGSDLASLRTEARQVGDEFVINGQKIWTSMAMHANHIYVLARTDKAAKKQNGISFLLVDMRQPGVKVRPIRNIAGHEEFCEVFFDDARTPVANLVGHLNEGWTVAKTLLGFERNMVGSPRQPLLALQRIERVAARAGLLDDPVFVDRLTALTFDVLDLSSLFERFAQGLRDGANPGAEVSIMKIWATETLQRLNDFLVDACGDAGAIAGPQPFGDLTVDVLTPCMDTRAATIYGGSSQIQRNILAKRMLNLP